MAEQKRRCYDTKECPLHADLESKAKGALPRWVFIAFIGLILALGSWRELSNAEMKKDLTASISGVKTDLNTNVEKLESFIRENNKLFQVLSISLAEIKANQKNTIENQKELMKALREHEQARNRANGKR